MIRGGELGGGAAWALKALPLAIGGVAFLYLVNARPLDPTLPRELHGAAARVVDGDTLDLGDWRIRLANLNCAERGTPEGDAATLRLRRLVAAEPLVCRSERWPRLSYGRLVAWCARERDGADLGELMIGARACRRW